MRGPAALAVVVLTPLLLAAGAPSAQAAPTPSPAVPGAGQVRQARSAAEAKAAEVNAVQAVLSAASARLDAARLAAQQAAEDYNAAEIKLAAADQAARAARHNAAGADAGYQRARVEVARIANQAYRDGGDLSLVGAMLEPGGPQDMLDRSALLDNLGAGRSQVMQRMDASRVVATLLQEQADDALRRQQEATAALAAARDRAQATAAAAVAAVTATQAQQARLVAQLAALRHTSVALERQRQAALATEEDRRNRPSIGAPGPDPRTPGAGSGGSGPGSGGSGSGSGEPGSGTGSGGPGSSRGGAGAGQAAVDWAKRQLGLPYQWGGVGPRAFDCSGLTMRAWQRAGVDLPHYAASQYEGSAKVPYAQMRPGDLIFYASNTANPATIHHVAMYVGGGMMIEAPFTGASVRIVAVRWNRTMDRAGRP